MLSEAQKNRKEKLEAELREIQRIEEEEQEKIKNSEKRARAEKAKKGNEVIAEKLKQVALMIEECEKIANECGVSFYSPIQHYGMGGTFRPQIEVNEDDGEIIYENSDSRWVSSSENC